MSYRPFVLGIGAGLVSGLAGGGGGLVIVPGLVLWIGMAQHRASATSSAAIVASAATALTLFGAAGDVAWAAAGWLFAGSAFGALVAARIIDQIPDQILTRGFALVVILAAVRMVMS